ncbi:SDR family NAD(P)-dependent oxidoreductase [Pseudomaricurvus alkylphenolicus]|uniref:SDR family NAD(P)-dependent oxidoreductase n=1 Tax=Pseudomaricurvus alkylphenolicus TaxID=1306991 RepID=UPI00142294BC|nr:SDR family NAD(P)-dependent oxidoreductase [Pseudomaricurvus alkylphenolicus]NIB38800.1 SDR family NAD(P)-dependent oxidoreductase [Pseudomaricurvus alkylphenolicus]
MSAQTLLVTGANGDIGRYVVNQALAQGRTVFASIRNEAHKETFQDHPRLHFLIMYMDQPDSIHEAFAEMDRMLNGSPLDAVIHCAAMESPSTVEFLKPEVLEQIIRINSVGSLAIMQASFPRLRRSGGNLILASSLWGRISGPLVSAYSASKWALESLGEAARRETRHMGFNIVLANIGAVKSRMMDAHVEDVKTLLNNASDEEQRLYAHAYESHAEMTKKFDSVAISVEKVSDRLLAIADNARPKARYKMGLDARLLTALSWLLPSSWMDMMLGIGKPKESGLSYRNAD